MQSGTGGGWTASLAAVLAAHNRTRSGGSVASFATQDKRSDVLYSGFRVLRELGFKLKDVHQFKGKHVEALAKAWESRGLSPSTIQNSLSIFRTFAEWIGKAGMVEAMAEGASRYVSAGAATRSSINREDKSWTAKGVDPGVKIAEVRAKDERVALQLEIQQLFGLRVRESLQLRPHVADRGVYLAVNVGTKGGRDRVVPIDTPEKRELIDRAKTFAASKLASISDPTKTLAQAKGRFYSVVRACGIKRTEGITSHGLRHAMANDRYEEETGQASPVRGGGPVDRETDRAARQVVAEELGHSRGSVSTHYLGGRRRPGAGGGR